jgi:hypothetical protein
VDLGKMVCGDTEWIGLVQDRNQWSDVLKSEMNLGGSKEVLEQLHNWQLLKKGSVPRS